MAIIRPWCWSTRPRTSERPRPKPPPCRVATRVIVLPQMLADALLDRTRRTSVIRVIRFTQEWCLIDDATNWTRRLAVHRSFTDPNVSANARLEAASLFAWPRSGVQNKGLHRPPRPQTTEPAAFFRRPRRRRRRVPPPRRVPPATVGISTTSTSRTIPPPIPVSMPSTIAATGPA